MGKFNLSWRWFFSHRSWFLWGGSALALWASLRSDPDGGLSTLFGSLALVQGIWAIAASHWSRKALMNYPEADMQRLFRKASEGSIGAGLALISIAIMFFAGVMVFAPRAHAADLPAGFIKYGPTLKVEQQRYWSAHPCPEVLAALVEQESCISLKSKGCWNPAAKLKSEREEGAGMGQITRAYRADGSQRFDALAGLRGQYSGDLGELSWQNVYTRPDLQLRAIVLMSRDNAKIFRVAPSMLAFGDAAYNGGASGVQKERRACALTQGCDPGQWFGNVELHCLKSRQPLYGGRNACDINREHVRNVFLVRADKYRKAWAGV
ncbi:MAG: hypothetical protein WC742_12655 [Gallionellaceae bacterium]|jgi:hypothetical protein